MHLKTVKHPLIFFSILAFFIHQIIEKGFNFSVPVLHAYLDDLVCIPITLGMATQVIQWIHPLKELYYLNKTAVILSVLFYCILFEGILPFYNPLVFTADWIDIIMYAVGGFLYYQIISKRSKDQLNYLMQKLD